MCLGTSKTLNWTTCKNAHVTFKRTLNCSEYQPRRSVHHFDFWHLNRSHAGLRLFLFTGVSQKHSKDHMLDTPHRRVPDLETSSFNKHQLSKDQLTLLEHLERSEYQAQVIDHNPVPKKMMPIVDYFCLHVLESWILWTWVDQFLFTHAGIVDILLDVILIYFAYLFFKSAYWHIRAYGFCRGCVLYFEY